MGSLQVQHSNFDLSRREKILRSQKTTSAATMNLLTRMVALLSMVCLAASFPQATSNQVKTRGEYNVKNLKLCPDARMSWAKLFPNLRGAVGAEPQIFWIFIQNYLKFCILLL